MTTRNHTKAQDHKLYYNAENGSPMYIYLYDRYGKTVDAHTANLIAKNHCTTLEDMLLDGMERVDTLDLIISLGY